MTDRLLEVSNIVAVLEAPANDDQLFQSSPLPTDRAERQEVTCSMVNSFVHQRSLFFGQMAPAEAEMLAVRLARMKVLVESLEANYAETAEQRDTFAKLHRELAECCKSLKLLTQ